MKKHIFSFLRYAIILFILLILYIYNNHAVTLMLLIFAFLVPSISILGYLFSKDNIEVTMEFNQYLTFRNNRSNLLFHIKNQSAYPHNHLILRFKIQNGIHENDYIHEINLYVNPKSHEEYEFPVSFNFCGVFQAELLQISTSDIFNFIGGKKDMHVLSDIVVLPSKVNLSDSIYDFSGQAQDDDIFEAQSKGEDHSEIFEIREYAPGDTLQMVHWKLSAKLDLFLIKEFGDLTGEMFQIFLELAYSDNKQMDAFFDLLWSISDYFCSKKMKFSICYVGGDEEIHRVNINEPEDITDLIIHLYYEKVDCNKPFSVENHINIDENSKTYFLLTNLVRPKSQNLVLMVNNSSLARMYKITR